MCERKFLNQGCFRPNDSTRCRWMRWLSRWVRQPAVSVCLKCVSTKAPLCGSPATQSKNTLCTQSFCCFFFCYFLIYSITVSHNWLCGQKWHIYVINCSLLLKTDVNVKKQNLCTVLSQSRSDMGKKTTCLGGGLKQPIKKKEVIFSLQLHPVPCFCSCFRNWIFVPLDLGLPFDTDGLWPTPALTFPIFRSKLHTWLLQSELGIAFHLYSL